MTPDPPQITEPTEPDGDLHMKSTTLAAVTCPVKWCADHYDGTPPGKPFDADDQLCRRYVTIGTLGTITVTHSTGDGTTAGLYNLRDELTRDELVELAAALLSLADDIRTEIGE